MQLLDWVETYEGLFAALGLLSVFLFLLSLLIFPLIIIYLPHDYFVRSETPFTSLTPLRMFLRIIKNAFGCCFILAGILMLFLPGQGLLCLLLGVSLLNLPGKRQLEIRLLQFKKVRSSVAWVRQKARRRPITLPE
jgi:hypothetical protein